MTNSHQISPAQLYSIFFVSRILVTLTYIPALNEIALSSDLLVQAFLYPLGMIISALPLYALYQARPDWDIFDCAYRISPVLSKILAVLYALFFLFVALLSVTRFDCNLAAVSRFGFHDFSADYHSHQLCSGRFRAGGARAALRPGSAAGGRNAWFCDRRFAAAF